MQVVMGTFSSGPFVLAALLSVLAVAATDAAPQGVSEPALKAAFLLNFAKFTDWPAGARTATAPLVLCSADHEVSPALEQLAAGQVVDQRPLRAAHVSLDGPVRECALLYVGRVDDGTAVALARALGGAGVLTVGDEQAFAAAGGMIGLFVEDGRMRFAINVNAVERGRMRLSAKLLTLARIVKD